MTSGQFRECLEALRWTQAQVAEELGLPPLRVRKMSTGREPVPEPIASWIRALSSELEEVRRRHVPPTIPQAPRSRKGQDDGPPAL
jgi:transcriptional regulator with XRE-family HTH domain